MVGGPSIVYTRRAAVDETFVRKSSKNLCKSIVGMDGSQLCYYSMCQPMPTGLCTRWEYVSDTKRFRARQNNSRSFESMDLSYVLQSRPDCKIESNVTTGRQRKLIASVWMEFVIIATLCLKQWGVIITTAPVKKHVPL